MLELQFKQRLGQFLLDIDTILPATGITAIFGLSGAGKTSLINVISGLTSPDQGHVVLNRRPLVNIERKVFISPQKRRIGYVFQDARLFPHYTVKGNLTYGMPTAMKQKFNHIIQLLGIEHLLKRYPFTLSGGEKQRVAIGRALLTNPSLLLMDEPLAALDLPRKQELMPYLQRLSHQVNIPILYVTHSIDEIIQLAANLLLLEQGKVVMCDTLENVWASDQLQCWLQSASPSSILRLPLLHHHTHYPLSALSLAGEALWVEQLPDSPGTEYRVEIAADDIALSQQAEVQTSQVNILPVVVNAINAAQHAGYVDVQLQAGDKILWSRITRWAQDRLALAVGQHLYAQIQRVKIYSSSPSSTNLIAP